MKRILAFLLTVIMVLAVLPAGVFAVASDFSYSVSNNMATVTGYVGVGGNVTVDETLGGATVGKIVYDVFAGKSTITGLTLPSGVTEIDDSSFSGCTGLKSFRCNALKLDRIGDYAFYNCSSLTDVILPITVDTFAANAFAGCTALTSFAFPAQTQAYGNRMFMNCSSLKTVTLNNSVSAIVYSMFQNCTALTDVLLPQGVTSIDANAFMNCSALEKLEIPEEVTSIGLGAFSGCTKLTLYVKKGSAAEKYAIKYNIPYISCTHDTTHLVDVVPAGYSHTGTANRVCDECEEVLETVITPKLDIAKKFSDVPNGTYFTEHVAFCLDNGYVAGTTPTTFAPALAMTRASLVIILYRMENSPEVNYSAKFKDVADNTWFTDAVMWASEEGIVTGDAGRFRPADSITRQEIAAILFRYAKFKDQDVSEQGDITGYADYSKLGAWAREAMSWANAKGIITGNGNNLMPAKSASRAEVVTMLARYIKAYSPVR